MPFDDDPEDRINVGEVMLVIAGCLIVVPGLIWWIGVFLGIFFPTVLGVNR